MLNQNCRPVPDCIAVVNSSETLPDIVAGMLSIPGISDIEFSFIRRVKITCAQVETKVIAELTPAAFDRGDCCDDTGSYSFVIFFPACDTGQYDTTFSKTYTKDRTATLIVDDFVALINAHEFVSQYVTASNSSGKIRLVANDAGVEFTIPNYSDTFTTVTVQNVSFSFGQDEDVIADLTAAGLSTATVTNGETYTAYDIFYLTFVEPADLDQRCCGQCFMLCERWCRVYVEDATDTASFVTALCAILDGTHTPNADYHAKITSCACVEPANGCPNTSFSYVYSATGDTVTITNTTPANLDTIVTIAISVKDVALAEVTASAYGAIDVAALNAAQIQTIVITTTFASGCVEIATAVTGAAANTNPSGNSD